MHKFIPHTKQEINEMLDVIGVSSIEDLFADIPSEVRYQGDLPLDKSQSEITIRKELAAIANKNKNVDDYVCFLGAGAYDHYVPSVVNELSGRSEFYTSYTPYQPEVSQGTLQAIFEFQSMITDLTDMDITNASMYDASTAGAEACFMSCASTKRKKVLVSKSVRPDTKKILTTYLAMQEIELVEIDLENGRTSLSALDSMLDESVSAVFIQSPNFYGIIEDIEAMESKIHANKSHIIMSVDPISLGLLKSPGELNADIVIGDAQPLGNYISFGGPFIGYMAAKKSFLRKMPGRIVGETNDADGKRGYVLTLQAREQHIRRSKASSNICSNQGLMALRTTIYLSVMGKQGLHEVAKQSFSKASYLYKQIEEKGLAKLSFDQPFFKEFAIDLGGADVTAVNRKLIEKGFIGGYDLGKDDPSLKGHMLLCVTEKRSKEEMDAFVSALGEVL